MQAVNQNDTKNSKGLGRGLDSLIPTDITLDGPVEKPTRKVSINLIDPNPHQPRREFNEETLVELANSIKEYGVIQPLLVTKAGNRYQLVAGERRLRAAKVAGLSEVPVIERTMEEQEKLEVAIIENLQREDLNPLELATSYKRLVEQFNLTQDEMAKRVGKARSTVANTMRLLSLPIEVKQALIEGKITEGHARALLNLPTADEQIRMLAKILNQKLNVREIERKSKTKDENDPNYRAAEKRLGEALQTKVKIKKSGVGGKIIVDYYSFEDFERIFRKIVE